MRWQAAVALCSWLAFSSCVAAEEVERDRCACKLAQRGAESTLKGGTCVRTETTSCLMEWGGGSTSRVPSGNGLSQRDAGIKAESELTRDNGVKFELPRFGPVPDGATPLQNALIVLSRVPPKDYGQPGVAESFVLAAGSALIRFAKGPLNFLATSLLGSQRERFVKLLATEGSLQVEQFIVRGSAGCLQIDDPTQDVHVFVKTPFAASERC